MNRYLLCLSLLVAACCQYTLGRSLYKEPRFFPRKVCYDGLGCFSTGGNFYNLLTRPLQVLPQDPAKILPSYELFTRRNRQSAQYIVYGDRSSVTGSNFNARLPTKIMIHGFLDHTGSVWHGKMRKALLQQGDYNVIQLDWTNGNQAPYTQATANTRVIGALLAQIIQWLESEFGANREKFHILGHSLGAHIAGYAGERLRSSSRQLGRITGMDPAGPYFENTHPEVRLDPTDARFVDAIHTDGDSILNSITLSGGLGMMQSVGHVDFYPNGGRKQPDCTTNPIINIIINGIVDGTKHSITCSHNRVLYLVISSIENLSRNYKAYPCNSYNDFKAGRCDSCGTSGCAQMGFRAAEWNRNGRSNVKMFLDTAGEEPFESTGPR